MIALDDAPPVDPAADEKRKDFATVAALAARSGRGLYKLHDGRLLVHHGAGWCREFDDLEQARAFIERTSGSAPA